MDCPRCGEPNPEDSIFCAACGASMDDHASEPEVLALQDAIARGLIRYTPLPGYKRCPSCSRLIFPEQTKCSRCDTGVATVATLQRDPPGYARCPVCDGLIFPEQTACPRCGAEPVTETPVQGEGGILKAVLRFIWWLVQLFFGGGGR